jgi:hypothetical protein
MIRSMHRQSPVPRFKRGQCWGYITYVRMLENGTAVLYEGERSRFAFEAREKQLVPLLLLIASETLPSRAINTINAAAPSVQTPAAPP